MSKEIIPCVCMTCGVRNDFSHPDGFCQKDHDNWLEFRDVVNRNTWFKSFAKKTGLTHDTLAEQFMNPTIKQFTIKNAKI